MYCTYYYSNLHPQALMEAEELNRDISSTLLRSNIAMTMKWLQPEGDA